MSRQPATETLIIGGGWAGLAAAVALAAAGEPVRLLESARQVGGRARCTRFGAHTVDNGQHLLIGAYRALDEVLRLLELPPERLFMRIPLELRLRALDDRPLQLNAATLPAPFNLLFGLLGACGLSLRERLAALRMLRQLAREGFTLSDDISVQELLSAQRQSPRLCRALWQPLCLATLNTHSQEASARLFLRVLKEAFTGARGNSDLLIPRQDLGHTLPEPAVDFIERHGGRVQLGRRVQRLILHGDRITGVVVDDEQLPAERVILAVGPRAAQQLLDPHPPLFAQAAQLAGLRFSPICTVYLAYPPHCRLPRPLIGLLDGISQWIFDRRVCDQAGIMGAVISGGGLHAAMDNDGLARHVARELGRLYPEWPAPHAHLVVREKRATFLARPDVDARRPAMQTAVQGLWLAGDYTATGLPATLEGALRSGLQCAREILSLRQTSPLPETGSP